MIPPLLYSAALTASLLDIRTNVAPVGLLSVVLVLVSALAVGVVATAVVPDLPLAAGVALGAVLAPPDAVAAIAIGRRVGLPRRLLTVIEGEGLINDATALTALLVAVEAVDGGFSLPQAAGQLLLSAGGGTAIGLGVAWLVGRVRRRLEEPLVENALSLATPFLAFVPAEELHVSGVLSVVVCGLVLGHQAPVLVSSAARLQSRAVWRLIDFLLEGLWRGWCSCSSASSCRSCCPGWSGLGNHTRGNLGGGGRDGRTRAPGLGVPRPYLPLRLSARLRERAPRPPWQETAVLSWRGPAGHLAGRGLQPARVFPPARPAAVPDLCGGAGDAAGPGAHPRPAGAPAGGAR